MNFLKSLSLDLVASVSFFLLAYIVLFVYFHKWCEAPLGLCLKESVIRSTCEKQVTFNWELELFPHILLQNIRSELMKMFDAVTGVIFASTCTLKLIIS